MALKAPKIPGTHKFTLKIGYQAKDAKSHMTLDPSIEVIMEVKGGNIPLPEPNYDEMKKRYLE